MGNSTMYIDNAFAIQVANQASERDIDFSVFQGTLTDNFIFFDAKTLEIEGIRRANYIIIEAEYVNAWSSDLKLTATNNIEKVEAFVEKYDL